MNSTMPTVGQKIIPLPDPAPAYGDGWFGVPEYYQDKIGTVTRVFNSDKPYFSAEFQSQQKPDDTTSYSFYYWKPADGHTLTVSSPEGREAELLQQVADLTAERDSLRVDLHTMRQSRDSWASDFHTYAEAVMNEAVERNWCETYEQVMESIQSRLQVAVIPERETEYEVEVEVRGEASTTHTVTVTARSQEEADEMVGENISDYVDVDEILTDYVRYNSWDSTEVDVQ